LPASDASKGFISHHSDCGMTTFTHEIMGDLLNSGRQTATLYASG
jgi:hypothetical protein